MRDSVTASDDSFAAVRPRLFGIAYRMLGSAAEAEDVVQDAWLRWQTVDASSVLDAPAFLATTTTRLAINVLQSARARHETYIGPWLPEPVDTRSDPELGAARGQALELAVLVLLEKLTPTERASYVLREAFDYPYPDIASILQLSEAHVRQLVTRARKHLESERQAPVSSAEQRRLLGAFLDAAQRGDHAALESLLASDVVSWTDGNGASRAARVPVQGREKVARFVAGFPASFWHECTFTFVEANGLAGVVASRGGAPYAFASIDASAHGIEHVFWVLSPAKLAAIARAAT